MMKVQRQRTGLFFVHSQLTSSSPAGHGGAKGRRTPGWTERHIETLQTSRPAACPTDPVASPTRQAAFRWACCPGSRGWQQRDRGPYALCPDPAASLTRLASLRWACCSGSRGWQQSERGPHALGRNQACRHQGRACKHPGGPGRPTGTLHTSQPATP